MDEIVEAFLYESLENLEQLDQDLLALEADPAANGAVASAFRALHTIKGTCGFFGFPHLEKLSHQAETLLGTVRDGGRTANSAMITLLLEVSDRIRAILAVIESQGTEPDEPNTALLERLGRAVEGTDVDVGTSPVAEESSEPPPLAPPDEESWEPQPAAPPAAAASSPAPTPSGSAPASSGPAPAAAATGGGGAAAATVRVGVPVLDTLMDLVGELVLARNQILQQGEAAHAMLGPIAERIDQITSDLQETATKTRMQPVRTVFSTLPRTARDVANNAGKDVRVLTEGEGTELDRSVLDAIRDPLTHLVRNAVDHGIESPDERVAAGKPAQGTVLLRGSHAAGQVVIEVIDDGGGIDAERVLRKAVERGVITAERAEVIGHRDTLDLIFMPGFSTAAAVTNVSGRGVGMDVVRTNVEAIGGTVELDSQVGRGSTVRITLPLTLAIIPALVVRSGEQFFALPQSSLEEVLQLAKGSETRLEQILDDTVVRHRDRLLPVIALDEVLDLPVDPAAALRHLVLLRSDGGSFGVVVDEVLDSVEIVVKPLHPEVRMLRLYSGVTILGDGTVALILDVSELARRCPPAKDPTEPEPEPEPLITDHGAQAADYLVARAATEVLAVPLGQVDRIEEVPLADVEWIEHEPFLQYRDEVLRLHGDPREHAHGTAQTLAVVVLFGGDPRTGVCVSDVDEVARATMRRDDGMVVVQGRLARVVGSGDVDGSRRW